MFVLFVDRDFMSLCEFVRQAPHTLCKGGLAAECLEFFCCLLLGRLVSKKTAKLKVTVQKKFKADASSIG